MKKSRFTDSQIMDALKRSEAGIPVIDICRELGVSTPAFYRWKSKYGGMDVSLMSKMKELEEEVILPFYRGFKSRAFMQPWLGAALV